jgi:hypothetical protein
MPQSQNMPPKARRAKQALVKSVSQTVKDLAPALDKSGMSNIEFHNALQAGINDLASR